MLSPKAVERREIGNPVSHLQSRKPFLGAIRVLKGSTQIAIEYKKKNQTRKIDKKMPSRSNTMKKTKSKGS